MFSELAKICYELSGHSWLTNLTVCDTEPESISQYPTQTILIGQGIEVTPVTNPNKTQTKKLTLIFIKTGEGKQHNPPHTHTDP